MGVWMANFPVGVEANRKGTFLKAAVSSLALMALCTSGTAWAQDDTEEPAAQEATEAEAGEETIVVTGLRAALQTARARKRNADTVMDSISATDIGAFPDKSVAEALQRVPGISVSRFAINTDTAHFTTEPSGVLVRGLPQVRSEFNGRDTFSTGGQRQQKNRHGGEAAPWRLFDSGTKARRGG